jgi:SAM-dependent methyltransferase
MLTAAQKRAKHGNVRFRQMDMNVPLDQPAASLDGVLCRWGYMLVNDPEAALKETRRVLRPGGTVALSAWTDPGENPWTSAAPRILQQRGIVGPDQPGPGQFAWADRDVIRENLEAAGFVEYRIEPLDFVMRYDDVDHWWVVQTQTGSRVAEADKTMDYAARSDVLADLEKVAERFELPDGSLAVPARTWVAAATA